MHSIMTFNQVQQEFTTHNLRYTLPHINNASDLTTSKLTTYTHLQYVLNITIWTCIYLCVLYEVVTFVIMNEQQI